MIIPKYHQINPIKNHPTKIQLHALMNDVQKSRIAVENITTFASGDGKFKQKIANLQQELQSCITNVNIQTKRHKLLSELVSLLKGQMFKYQSTKKKQEEEEEVKRDKQIAKLQYEIDQILQKHNEQIAKIFNLKESANSRRSQRVVYSNLFKKLEKEIKHYEEIYKQNLIISQSTHAKTSKFDAVQQRNGSPNKELSDADEKKKLVEEFVRKNYEKRSSLTDSKSITPSSESAWNFITQNKQQGVKSPIILKSTNKKIYLVDDTERTEQKVGSKQQKLLHTKDLLKQISSYTNLIEKIKVHLQCTTLSELIEHYSSLQQQNANLTAKIRQCDESIDQIVEKGEKFNKKIVQEEVARNYTISHSLARELSYQHINSQSSSNVIETQEEQFFKIHKQIMEVGKLCGIELRDENKQKLNGEFFQKLDKKLAVLSQQITRGTSFLNKRQDTVLSETIVDCLTEKMDKYQNCQRILDQNLFRQEYYKQLNKRRPNKSKKDTAK